MKSIFESVKKANAALTEAQKGMSIEDLERLRENMEEVQKEMRKHGRHREKRGRG